MKIDLNCDLGESFGNYKIGNDQSVIPLITSANIACGFHAGDENVMAETVKLAKQNHVGIGAHPGFPDLQGFGRRNLDMSLKEIFNIVVYQVGALKTFCDIQGVKLNHVKPHGALYQMASRNADIAKAIASAIHQIDPKLYLMGLSNSILIEEGRKQGLNVASEVFADRRYENDGQLVSRKKEGAVIEDSHEAIEQVLQMVKEGTVKTISGEIIDIKADTICVHGDGAHALDFVKQIRSHLSEENINISTLGG
ncbi:LamB/YcsF family protein [Staphylococcus schleiferi]|uniref:5-oxoprolinase subunit PxpA n=1 Tax=Staphylococcus coagulans TaxID=74706 RepID=UPI00067A38A4|nr:5-oxoprolinase subunit PxpA [Staphylococcus coagulans]AKS69072.1 LamB/YcsF family protein [Staphylococcus schleiferi]AKS71293.1 LamB/YcsF family protein [Staphylococcus schleiferi]AKS73464.1 LamB/YcsF family protein [Staphylococcus schleiferi]MBA8763215.1 5-oxoprolinase subunit PxpA [Staphylococcus coagulans]MBT2808791.1 5-oxoprolinase subunit PxpA [Staphylococcus coagulans]